MLASEITSFYAGVQEEMHRAPIALKVPLPKPVKWNGSPEFFEPTPRLLGTWGGGTLLRRLRSLVRRRPIVMATGGFAVIGALSFMLLILLIPRKGNPQRFTYSPEREAVSFVDVEGKVLWEVPWKGEGRPFSAVEKLVKIVDLDGDGENEAVVAVSSMGIGGPRVKNAGLLRAYSSRGALLWERNYSRAFSWRGRAFEADFNVSEILPVLNPETGTRELIVLMAHVHSPFVLVRIDNDGREIGSYWHFGHFFSAVMLTDTNSGSQHLVLAGVKDVDWENRAIFSEDDVQQWRPVLAALDPWKILGTTAATVTPGFGFALSEAELHYIAFPTISLDSIVRSKPRISEISHVDSQYLSLWRNNGVNGRLSLPFQYTLTRDFEVVDVKASDAARNGFAKLRSEGRIRERLDESYLSEMMKGIRYWDGREWNATSVSVVREQRSNLPNPKEKPYY
ncbi:MAG: hypothetical protein HYZ01_01670 [Ignavibacteriales bacterium]|nr:hypothetical protein [Ignavibacteriales bacterium]